MRRRNVKDFEGYYHPSMDEDALGNPREQYSITDSDLAHMATLLSTPYQAPAPEMPITLRLEFLWRKFYSRVFDLVADNKQSRKVCTAGLLISAVIFGGYVIRAILDGSLAR